MTRIMFVDDEENVLRSLQRSLRRQPWDIITYTDPHEALHHLQREEFAVVVSDYRMPGINGVQFLEYCRFRQKNAVRVILSAHTEKNGMLEAVNTAQIYRFLTKPWDEGELIGVLKNAIETYQLKEEKDELLMLVEDQRRELTEQRRTLQAFAREHPELVNVTRDMEDRIVLDGI